ncbi:MAG: cytochrome P450 [Propionibacteriales bacterium]|nr:cytochrome P450 [Propionibacteriales bacterium]
MLATSRLDLADPGFIADPYPALAALRAQADLAWHEPTGRWLATTHAAVGATLRHRSLGRIWSDLEPAERFEPFSALHRNQMMENEPPAHTRLRRLVAGAFARGHVERLRPRVQELATDLLDRVSGDDVDVLAAYAEPLPVAVIAELLGVPASDRGQLRDWSQRIVAMYEHGRTLEVEQAAITASEEFSGYVRALVTARQGDLGDDLVSDLIRARDGDGRLSSDELVASVVLLLNAGHEASVNVFGNGLVALLRHPGQLRRVVSGEVPVEVALEEMIRFDAPLQLFERTATAEVEVAGVEVAAGQKVAALMGSANRDAAVFPDADGFDAGREPNPHVGFGMGLHFCLGAPLARMELAVSVAELLRRFPRLALAEEPEQRPTFVLRGYRTIRLDLRGAA